MTPVLAVLFLVSRIQAAGLGGGPLEAEEPGSAPSATAEAVAAAGLSPSDPLDDKVAKILRLLNDRGYLEPKGEPPKFLPPFDEPYHLDSLRTPEDILSQKVGGYCASKALAAAAMLAGAGVPKSEDRKSVV